jgi:hypothetical protein
MTSTLYELADARDLLDRVLEEHDGELTPEIEALLNDLDVAVNQKVERVGLYIRERLAHSKAVKEERDRLNAIAQRDEKTAESLKSYLLRQMERLGKTKVEGVLLTVAVQNNPPSVKSPLDSDQLREHYDKASDYVAEVPASYRIDRDKVLAAFKMGAQLPEWVTVERGTHIRLR